MKIDSRFQISGLRLKPPLALTAQSMGNGEP
jgi:hypothetical protein